jgi:hypothetical protein
LGLATGSPYSHGLKHFLNDINADESLIESNIAGSSEVGYCQEISKILYMLQEEAGEIRRLDKVKGF